MSAGFPIAVGYPHFYKADPAVINAIEGVYPDASKHQTHFIIEPVSLTTKIGPVPGGRGGRQIFAVLVQQLCDFRSVAGDWFPLVVPLCIGWRPLT